MTASIRKYADLYHDAGCAQFIDKLDWNDDGIPDSWRQALSRSHDRSDRQVSARPALHRRPSSLRGIRPEDGGAPLQRERAVARRGNVEAVYTSKLASDCAVGTCVLDHERGVADGIAENPWQTDTCIGNWHYKRGMKYKTPKKVIDLLTDIVSKNGNLLLNFPLPNSGELDFEEMEVLEGITAWMQVNSEGIYATRPWKIYGEGPSTKVKIAAGNFNEDKQNDLTAEDVRFTAKGSTLYAFVHGLAGEGGRGRGAWPGQPAAARQDPQSGVARTQGRRSNWKQDDAALKVQMPAEKISDIGITLKVELA